MKFLAAPLVLSLVLSGLLQSAKRLPVEELMPAAEDTVAADTLTHSYTSISAIGDLMCHSTQYKYVATGDGHYDFTPCFSAIAPVLKMADLCRKSGDHPCRKVEAVLGVSAVQYT